MSKFLCFILSLIIIAACTNKKQTDSPKYDNRNIYVEFENVPEHIKTSVLERSLNRIDTIDWFVESQNCYLVYNYKDASNLPTSNLLDGTRKLKIRLNLETDSIGNPVYHFSQYESDNSNWRRRGNMGNFPFRSQDTLVSDEFVINFLDEMVTGTTMKGLP